MGKRLLMLVFIVGAIALLIAGVAVAAGPGGDDQQGIDPTTVSTEMPVTVPTDVTESTDATEPTEVTETTEAEEPTEVTEPTEADDQTTDVSEVHPDNFGGTISAMRHQDPKDLTPAALVKDPTKKSGWTKNHAAPTTTTIPGL